MPMRTDPAEPRASQRSHDVVTSLADAARLVGDRASIGFGGGLGLQRRPVEFARELIRQGRRSLDVFGVINGIETDLLIAGGCVASTNTSYVGLDDIGQAPYFQAAAARSELLVNEYSEWLITARFRAANMGLPYIPWPSSRLSDSTRHLGFRETTCPYTGMLLLAVPAVQLDVAVIQAVRCDAAGNTEFATPLDMMYDVDALVARAASTVIVCTEEIGAIDRTRTQLVGREVDAVVESPRGSWPAAMLPLYGADRSHLLYEYLRSAEADDFVAYKEAFIDRSDV